MSDLFNTPFEISMRILLTLLVSSGKSRTVDMIAAADFLTIYSRDFGIADYNLHGENSFNFSELASRRKLMNEAIKQLVVDGLIAVVRGKQGFQYKLNARGKQVCDNYTTDYAAEYISLGQDVYDFIDDKTELEVMNLINNRATMARERRTDNG